ncbi:MAG: HAD hydrolase-like protein [Fulvivirga sp.]
MFEQLINSKDKELLDLIVIGDNPESEIKAANELGLTTVQVAKLGQPKSSYANYYIQNFQDLIQILEERA